MFKPQSLKQAGLAIKDRLSSLLIVVALLLLTLFSYLGLFQSVNNAIYEATPSIFSNDSSSPMVSMSIERHLWQQKALREQLINEIRSAGANKIIVLEQDPTLLNDLASLSDSITIVPKLQKSTPTQDGQAFSLSESVDLAEYSGVAFPLTLERGKVRFITLQGTLENGTKISSFLISNTDKYQDQDSFRINFDKVSHYISEVTAQQVLAGNITKQIFAGKTVVVGESELANQSLFVTPYNQNGQGISTLQFYALALDAVEKGAELHLANTVLTLFFVLLTLSSVLFFVQKLSLYSNVFVLSSIIVAGVVGTTLLSHVTSTVWPITEFAFAALASYWIYFHSLQNDMANEVTQLSRLIKKELSTSKEQISFNEVENPWIEISAFVQQYLQLDKTIFLEKIPGDHRVKEIQALNCSLDDIQEMRRDYQRTPYSTAIKENRPVEINRSYFNNIDSDEKEFIAPLIFAGEVLGFWAMTYKPKENWNKQKFLLNVESFAEQIAVQLYRRNIHQLGKNKPDSTTRKMIKAFFPNRTDNALRYNVHHSLKRLALYQNIFNTMQSSAIIYDLFGRVVEANHSMEQLSTRSSLNIFNLNALELLHNITGIEKNDIRARLRQVILLQQETHFTTTSQLDEHTYMISVSPVIADNSKSINIADNDHIFSVIGVLVEFIDVGVIHHMMTTERTVTSQYFSEQQALLEQLSTTLEQTKDISAASSLVEQIQSRHLSTASALKEMANHSASTVLPVNLYNSYLTALANSQKVLESKRLKVNASFPEVTPIIMSNPDDLVKMIQLMLSVLTDDAQVNSSIEISCHYKQIKGKKAIYFSIANTGFGVPKEHIEELGQSEYINEHKTDALTLKNLMSNVEQWNATARVHTKLGKGIRFSYMFSGV